jgi:hypothetical protein
MASKHPRLGVPRDPALERALALTRPLLGEDETRSAAAQVRALALRGADSLIDEAGPVGELRRKLVEQHGVRPATRDPRTFEPPRDGIDPADPTPASDALRWVRGE